MSPVVRRAAAVVGAALLAAVVARGWRSVPARHEAHYLLGSRAPSVVELDARWTDDATGEVVRDASFRFAAGRAPRVVVHEPELAEGRYTVAIDTVTVTTAPGDGAAGAADPDARASARRRTTHVTFPITLDGSGAEPSFDLAPVIAREAADPSPRGDRP